MSTTKEQMIERITGWLQSEGVSSKVAERIAPHVFAMSEVVCYIDGAKSELFIRKDGNRIRIRAVTGGHPNYGNA